MHISECAMKHLTKSQCALGYHCDLSVTVRTGRWRFIIIKPHINKYIKIQNENGIFSIDVRCLHLMDATTVSEPMQYWYKEKLFWSSHFMAHVYELTGA